MWIDHEDAQRGMFSLMRLFKGMKAAFADFRHDAEGEGRALSGYTMNTHLTAHEFNQFFTNRKPKSGSAELPVGRGLQLLEGLKQQVLLVLRNAHTGILYSHFDFRMLLGVTGFIYAAKGYRDMAAFGEFNGVAQKVQQDLTETGFIAHHMPRDIGLHKIAQADAFGTGACGNQIQCGFHTVAQVKGTIFEIQFSGLHF